MPGSQLLTADSPETLDAVLSAAASAAADIAAVAPQLRARALCAVADALEAHSDELVQLAGEETGLGAARLSGELVRTAVQLRLFADTVAVGDYLDVRIDLADANFALGARPDLRRSLQPLGPVVNFSASNFPFAFSVAGGDSAAILAAGCPLIVKAHSGHPELSLRTAQIVDAALRESGLPEGAFALISGQETGVAALRDPRVRAGSFTGSIGAGRLLADIAAARPNPIPFYGELGSVNPVIVTTSALSERSADIAAGYFTSVSGSAGQLCTKPGFLFVPAGADLHAALASHAEQTAPHRMLNPRIGSSYLEGVRSALAQPGVRPLVTGSAEQQDDGNVLVTPTIAAVSLADFLAHADALREEVFGPFSLIVEYPTLAEVPAVIESVFDGNLTGTLHLGEAEFAGETDDTATLRELTEQLSRKVGRVLFNGWPTGVAVTHAQQHGGPYPATTNDSSTSVGTAAITRFLRPVAYQGAPEHLLPEPLQGANPYGVAQRIDLAGSSHTWGQRGA